MLRLHYGRARVLFPALVSALDERRGRTHYIIVPKQLTLLTERRLLAEMHLAGSFELQVISCERLCDRIFDSAGRPEGDRVDDLGRVMLTRLAIKKAGDDLSAYKKAYHRPSFPLRAAKELQVIRQAQETPAQLREYAAGDGVSPLLSRKLRDLAAIQEAYETLIADKYLDSESLFTLAARTAPRADFLRECPLWFYGFDMMPPTMQALIATLGGVCPEVHVFVPAVPDEEVADADTYVTLLNSMKRLRKTANALGTPIESDVYHEEEEFALPARPDALRTLEHRLYADGEDVPAAAGDAVRLVKMRSAAEECAYAAATVRDLVRRKGWHYRDFQILCADTQGYSALLRSAFAAYDIPLVLADTRPALRNSMAEGLVCSLRVLDRGFPAEDMRVLLRSDLFTMDEDSRDALENYTIRYNLRGRKWTQPLSYGTEEERAAIEPLREKMMAPLLTLRADLKAAEDLPGQLKAVYDYLETLEVCARLREHMRILTEANLWETASEEGQVWNRIIGTLDRLCALMGSNRLSLRELFEIMEQSLGAAVIKALPQSDDSVYAQGMKVLCPQPVKALLILGVADRQSGSTDGLFSEEQRRLLSRLSHRYFGPEETDLARLNRYYLKSSIGMATDFVQVSCALAGPDGNGQTPSMLFGMMEAMFTDLHTLSSVNNDEEMRRLMLCAPSPVVNTAALGLAQIADDESVRLSPLEKACIAAIATRAGDDPKMASALTMLRYGTRRFGGAADIDPQTARALYNDLSRLSITQLETFTSCPFRYFLERGIRPVIVEPFAFRPMDEGNFLHSCAKRFVDSSRADLHLLSEDDARARMRAVATMELDTLEQKMSLGDSSLQKAIRRELCEKACESAAALARHMQGSSFRNRSTEMHFGDDPREPALSIGPDGHLRGIIDRVDAWDDYLRIIDYKRSETKLDLVKVQEGLSMQLPLYLAVARKLSSAQSAGIYYFHFYDGIVETDSTNPVEIAETRAKENKLTGLYPAEAEVAQALSPTAPKNFYTSGVAATAQDYDNVEHCALDNARSAYARILQGECGASPVGDSACTYCDHKDVCMFRKNKVRALSKAKNPEVLAELAERYRNQDKPEP